MDNLRNPITGLWRCNCCGYYTVDRYPARCDICPVCYWQDDKAGEQYPNKVIGPNHVALNQARKNYLEFGASEKEWIPHVRKPNKDEYGEIAFTSEMTEHN